MGMFYCERCGKDDCCERFDLPYEPVLCDACYEKATREKMIDVLMHIGDHIENKDEYGICFDTPLAKAIEYALVMLKSNDIVHVVRCKDCKHMVRYSNVYPQDIGCLYLNTDYCIEPEHFCSHGERRTDG